MNLPSVCILCVIFPTYLQSASEGICRPGCHSKNGFCVHPGECRCHSGWKGQLCDQCVPFPGCLHGTCTKPWQCNCEEGWIGSHCNIDIHPCAALPCSSNSTCIETGNGGYICLCAPNDTGNNCLAKKGPCIRQGSPCQNGGTCVDENGFATRASCQCPAGYVGNYCEANEDDCNRNPCANGGTCFTDGPGFHCQCPFGFSGQICTNIRPTICSSSPCVNGGTCYEKLGGFHCTCLPEYTGSTCAFVFKNSDHEDVHGYYFQSYHKPVQHQGHKVLKITMKETIHTMDPFLSRSQIICFIVLGLLTCLIVLITTGFVFFSKWEMWLANAKYSHLIRKKKDFYIKSKRARGNGVKIIFPEGIQIANSSQSYTDI
ncbi:protein delta homolog 1 [Pseudophryne corroboree]|uniref:protein delta homolog 1 n=1 Tax=Pseudophryne corroboree TaxID=495146 RepID=UPI0030818438